MNSPIKLMPLMLILMISAILQASASPNCGDCEEPNDPSLVLAGFPPCTNKPAGTAIPNEPCKVCDGKGREKNKFSGETIPGEDCKVCDGAGGVKNRDPGALIKGEYCKECNGKGGVREKKDGTVVFKNFRQGYCCGGVWYYGTKPQAPGCFKVNPKTCKWETYTPDCKVYEDMITRLRNFGWSLCGELLRINTRIAGVQVCCDCENGNLWACAKRRNCGKNECDHLDQLKINKDYIMWRMDEVDKKIKVAEKKLDDCQNCRK